MKILIPIVLIFSIFISCHTSKKMHNTNDIDNLEMQKKLLTEKDWKLITLYGQEIEMNENQDREIFFRLTSDGKLTGFGGCNPLSGSYDLQKGLRITFDKIATGLRYCEEDIPEASFLEALNSTDNYSFSNDYKILSLNKARMAPLAVFVNIEMD